MLIGALVLSVRIKQNKKKNILLNTDSALPNKIV